MKAIPDKDLKPGMIIVLDPETNEKWEILKVSGAEKVCLRREDLDAPSVSSTHQPGEAK